MTGVQTCALPISISRIGQGLPPREIAAELGISLKTVDVHRANLKSKLSLAHMSDLVRHAVQWVNGQKTG